MPRTLRTSLRTAPPLAAARAAALAAALAALLLLPACGDDDDPTGPQTATISVLPSPAELDAPWSLTGPDAFAEVGTGAEVLAEVAPGDYVMTWGEVAGYETPAPQTATVAAGETHTFAGEYTEQTLGTIVVTTLPEGLTGPWEITGPAGYQTSGAGSTVIDDREPGEYAITWERLPLWTSPAPLQMDVIAGDTTTFFGEYTELTGLVPDMVMHIFVDAHDVQSTGAYASILSEDFQFVPVNDEPAYGYDTELAIMDAIFTGEQGSTGYAFSDVAIVQFDPQGVWTETPLNDPDFGGFTGSMHRTYLVQIDFAVDGGSLILRVQGPAVFYVHEVSGQSGTEWRLLGIVDATYGGKGTENYSWSDVKAMFLPEAPIPARSQPASP